MQDHIDHQSIITVLVKNNMNQLIFDMTDEMEFEAKSRATWIFEAVKYSLEKEMMDLVVNLWEEFEAVLTEEPSRILESLL